MKRLKPCEGAYGEADACTDVAALGLAARRELTAGDLLPQAGRAGSWLATQVGLAREA